MNKKTILFIALLASIAFVPLLNGCGLRESPFLDRDEPKGSNDDHAADSDGKLFLDELEREIDELLNLLDQLETVDDRDLDL
jgi:hypothetical protein